MGENSCEELIPGSDVGLSYNINDLTRFLILSVMCRKSTSRWLRIGFSQAVLDLNLFFPHENLAPLQSVETC